MTHFVSHLEGTIDGTVLPFGGLAGTHAGRPIAVRAAEVGRSAPEVAAP